MASSCSSITASRPNHANDKLRQKHVLLNLAEAEVMTAAPTDTEMLDRKQKHISRLRDNIRNKQSNVMQDESEKLANKRLASSSMSFIENKKNNSKMQREAMDVRMHRLVMLKSRCDENKSQRSTLEKPEATKSRQHHGPRVMDLSNHNFQEKTDDPTAFGKIGSSQQTRTLRAMGVATQASKKECILPADEPLTDSRIGVSSRKTFNPQSRGNDNVAKSIIADDAAAEERYAEFLRKSNCFAKQQSELLPELVRWNRSRHIFSGTFAQTDLDMLCDTIEEGLDLLVRADKVEFLQNHHVHNIFKKTKELLEEQCKYTVAAQTIQGAWREIQENRLLDKQEQLLNDAEQWMYEFDAPQASSAAPKPSYERAIDHGVILLQRAELLELLSEPEIEIVLGRLELFIAVTDPFRPSLWAARLIQFHWRRHQQRRFRKTLPEKALKWMKKSIHQGLFLETEPSKVNKGMVKKQPYCPWDPKLFQAHLDVGVKLRNDVMRVPSELIADKHIKALVLRVPRVLNSLRLHHHALTIQCAWHQHKARQELKERLFKHKSPAAILVIQKHARRVLAVRVARRRRASVFRARALQNEHCTAVFIQAWWRMTTARRAYLAAKDRQRQQEAALKIQCFVRGWAARQFVRHLRKGHENPEVVSTINRAWRRKLAHRRVARVRLERCIFDIATFILVHTIDDGPKRWFLDSTTYGSDVPGNGIALLKRAKKLNLTNQPLVKKLFKRLNRIIKEQGRAEPAALTIQFHWNKAIAYQQYCVLHPDLRERVVEHVRKMRGCMKARSTDQDGLRELMQEGGDLLTEADDVDYMHKPIMLNLFCLMREVVGADASPELAVFLLKIIEKRQPRGDNLIQRADAWLQRHPLSSNGEYIAPNMMDLVSEHRKGLGLLARADSVEFVTNYTLTPLFDRVHIVDKYLDMVIAQTCKLQRSWRQVRAWRLAALQQNFLSQVAQVLDHRPLFNGTLLSTRYFVLVDYMNFIKQAVEISARLKLEDQWQVRELIDVHLPNCKEELAACNHHATDLQGRMRKVLEYVRRRTRLRKFFAKIDKLAAHNPSNFAGSGLVTPVEQLVKMDLARCECMAEARALGMLIHPKMVELNKSLLDSYQPEANIVLASVHFIQKWWRRNRFKVLIETGILQRKHPALPDWMQETLQKTCEVRKAAGVLAQFYKARQYQNRRRRLKPVKTGSKPQFEVEDRSHFISMDQDEFAPANYPHLAPDTQMRHAKMKVNHPVTCLDDALHDAAVANFQNLQSTLDSQELVQEGIDSCVAAALTCAEMADEVYFQVLKQLTMCDNAVACRNAWDILTDLLRAVSPSDQAKPYVKYFLKKNSPKHLAIYLDHAALRDSPLPRTKKQEVE